MKAIPNILSALRLVLCPVFVIVFFRVTPIAALGVFVFASLLDVADGFLARKLDAVSELGKILDPLADKVLQLSAVICFVVDGTLPLFAAILLGGKEFLVLLGGWLVSRKRKAMVYSNVFGKIASFCVSLALVLLFFVDSFALPAGVTTGIYVFLYSAIALSLAAMVQYGIVFLYKKDV